MSTRARQVDVGPDQPEGAGAWSAWLVGLRPRAQGVLRAALGGVADVKATNDPSVIPRGEVVVLGCGAKVGEAVLARVRGLAQRHPVVVSAPGVSARGMSSLIRAGAADVITTGDDAGAVVRGVRERRLAQEQASGRGARSSSRLRRAYRRVWKSRRELLGQVGTLCRDLAAVCREMNTRVEGVAVSSELTAVFRQELDLEGLLRTMLESALRRAGPMNAAVFLPGSTGDYSLGAYVNYDCSKDSAEALLDHLADVAAPAFEGREGPVVLRDGAAIVGALGQSADWMTDSTMVAIPCRQDGECLAVMVFFRDRRSPFGAGAVGLLGVIAQVFGAQLARVIRTHHRHLPKGEWKAPGERGFGPDDIDLAA